MISITIFATIIILSLILIIVGRMYRTQGIGLYMALAGFVMFMVLGMVMITGSPLQVRTGEIQNETLFYDNSTLESSSKIITYQYDQTNSTLDYLVSFILLITGLVGIGYVASEYYEETRRGPEREVEGYDDD